MNPHSPPFTPVNCTEAVWWPCYIGSDISFQDDIWEASSLGFQSTFSNTWYLVEVLARVPSQITSWEMLSVWGFILPVLEYCSAVRCSAADPHLKLLDRAVSGARFLNGGVVEYDIAHRRSVAVLSMLYKIRYNPMRPLKLRCSTWTVCVSAGYTRCHCCTSVYLCAASL